MNSYRISIKFNNDVVIGMSSIDVDCPHELYNAPAVCAELYPVLKTLSYNCSLVNDTTRCVVYPNVVLIVEKI